MKEFPHTSLRAVGVNELSSNTQILYLNELDSFILLEVDVDIATDCTLFAIDDITEDVKSVDYSYEDITHELNRIWYKVSLDILDVTPGHHRYRLSFVNKYTDDIFYQYISYVILDNTPEKPYIYMKNPDTKPQMYDGYYYE